MTDNAFCYVTNRSLWELLDRRAIKHLRTQVLEKAHPQVRASL
jgi:hypothetical protein